MKYAAFAATIFAGDQTVKKWAEKNLKFHEEKSICNGFIVLTKYHNSGVACNLLQGKRDFLIVFNSIVIGAVGILLAIAKKGKGKAYLRLAYSLILGGGLSNLYDRLTLGYVVDYFRFAKLPNKIPKPFRTLIFNLGDLAILLGSTIALIGGWNLEKET